MRVLALGGVLALGMTACGSDDPANVEGNYTIAITNRDNGCNLANWTVGDTSQGIAVQITQEGSDVNATVTGVTGGVLNLFLGSNMFSGDVDGTDLDLDLFGTRPQMQNTCTYTFNAKIVGDIEGDTLEGRVEYRAATTTPNNPDCSSIQGCLTFQEFNGTRPPT